MEGIQDRKMVETEFTTIVGLRPEIEEAIRIVTVKSPFVSEKQKEKARIYLRKFHKYLLSLCDKPKEEILLNAKEWCEKFGIDFDRDIEDLDGWDRKDLDRSLAEKITEGEFRKRMAISTVCFTDNVRKMFGIP
jgi:hypothetical protein